MNIEKLKLKTSSIRLVNIDFDLGIKNNGNVDDETIFFVKTLKDLDNVNKELQNYNQECDTLIYILFPKKTSKKYKSENEVSRDIIKDNLLTEKFNLVSLVSINEDLSGARIRFNKFIKTLNK